MTDLTYDGIEIGREFGPWQYPLAERIARHLEAVENAHPWHHERSPWGPPVAPPTILAKATLRFLDSIAPLPPGTLHARQEMEIESALRLDRRLIGYGRFTEKQERQGRRWFVFEARFRDETGLIMGHSRATLAFPEPVETPAEAEEGKGESAPGPGELTAISRTLTQEKITAYSEAESATTVAPGLMSADYISELMTGVFGQRWFIGSRLSLVFARPVLPGDTLTANGRAAERTDEGSFTRQAYQVWCQNGHGEAVTVGTASGLLPAGSSK